MGCLPSKEEKAKAETEAENNPAPYSDKTTDDKSSIGKTTTRESTACFFDDFEKIIDRDQYLTSKILECLSLMCNNESEDIKKIGCRVIELISLKNSTKLSKFFDLRIEETEVQKKLVKSMKDHCKELQKLVGIKYSDIDERFENVQSIIRNKYIYSEERLVLKKTLEKINKVQKPEFGSLVNDLKSLFTVEKSLIAIEKSLPKLNEDPIWLMRLKELEQSLGKFVKSSMNSLKNIEHIFGNCQATDKIDVYFLQNFEIDVDTYTTFAESLKSWVNNINELEIMKESSLTSDNITQQLRELDEKISMYFFDAEERKQNASNKFKRMSRNSTGLGMFIHEVLKHIDTSDKTLEETANKLYRKVNQFIKTAESQDSIITDMTERLSEFDKKIDEIELKFSDLIENLGRELHKCTPLDEIDLRDSVDEIRKKVGSKEGSDMLERLELFSMKVDFACEYVVILQEIYDLIIKDHNKLRNDVVEKNNELSNKLALCENDKNNLEDNLKSLKSNYEISCEIAEKYTKAYSEKDLENANLKANINSLTLKYEEISQARSRETEEIDNLTSELRACKKTLRIKETELNDLKSSLEQN
ncbi:hypothetical protein SteCoe_7518 [Stentor coeruleus]|uniref:Uncharacterized protein n=1 Tax=Stentor coeruleus TaxID=5963 RepID=A0A1R2CMP2_9CILI|nr:hypothetical protein SteCoe_7518 [Stentor coeruleus]